MAGRLRTAQGIRQAIASGSAYGSAIMPTILSDRSMRRFAEAVWTMLGWLFKGQPLPMQCALFAARSDVDALCRQIPKEGAIYLDGIRLYVLARRLRAERPSQRIVMDIDDLLSRRTDLLLKGRQPQSPGYLTEQFSLFTRFLIAAFSRWILIYERWALRGVERRSVAIADAAVLVSASFDHLERFIFVGADVLTQNRLTIDYLIKLWRRYRPSTPLVLFGIQQRDRPLPEGMSAAGYVESLSDIYNPQSVLLTPSFIGGGIKTKVLEAFAHRVPVIGNSDTFESLALADYPLAVTEESQLIEMVLQPDKFGPALRHAAEEGYAYVQDRYPPTVFADRWRAVLALPKLPDRRTLS